MRKLAERLRRVAKSSKFGIARERCSRVWDGVPIKEKPYQRPSGEREFAGRRQLAKSSKFGIARERLQYHISGIAVPADLCESEYFM